MRKLILSAFVALSMPLLAQKYINPVYNSDFPDPSVQRAQDGTFYSYATGCATLKSQDLMKWTVVNNVFDRPTWNDTTYIKNGASHTDYYSLWASDVNYTGGRYVMYYASALWGNGSRTGIGVAVGTSPYKFYDVGRLFRSTEIKVENSIDPVYYEEFDKKYLAWGSFNGIYITELSENGLSVKDPSNLKRIAGTAFEGAMIHKHGRYYYLFCSVGSCCEGLNSTYKTVVGRSSNILGPYISKSGSLMTNNGYTVIISSNQHWKGNGHNSEIITDDEGQDWILYHGYDASDADKGRVLLMDQLKWDSMDWPYIEGGTPSFTEQDGPVFYKGNGAHVGYRLNNLDFQKSQMQGWTVTAEGNASVESGLGTAFMPLMHASGQTFKIEQSRNGMTDGLYEVRLRNFSTQPGVQINVNAIQTPVIQPATTITDVTKISDTLRVRQNYVQSAYGLVVGNTLKIGMSAQGLEQSTDYWAGNVEVIRRDKDETALAAVLPWYVERAEKVVADENVDSYYRGKVSENLQSISTAVTVEEKYNALVSMHKMLDRAKALDPNYGTAVTSVAATPSSADELYNLQGTRVPQSYRGIVVSKGRKILK